MKQAMALHDEAWVLYEQGRYRAAVDRLEAALLLDPEGRELVYNLALIHEKLADLGDAVGYYRRYLEMEPDARTRARIQLVLRPPPQGRGRARGGDAAPRRPSPKPPAVPVPPPPRRVRPWVLATASVGGAAFLMGSAFGLTALARNPGANAHTGGSVTIGDLQADAHAAHTDAVIADVSFLLALARGQAPRDAVLCFDDDPVADERRAPRRAAPAPSPWGPACWG